MTGVCAIAVACKPIDEIRLEPTIEGPAALSSAVRLSDSATVNQLIRGFYDLQGGSWRWTAPQFAVLLAAPPGSATKGARLTLEFTLPDPSIATLKNITVTAKVNRVPLTPETYSTSGAHTYRSEVPASAFVGEDVTAEFSVDKFLTPPNDGRNLALVVTAIALELR